MKSRHLVVVGIFLAVLLVCPALCQATVLSIEDSEVVSGGSKTVPIFIYNVTAPQGVGTVQFNLLYNASVLHITATDDRDTDFSFVTSGINNTNGVLTVGGTFIGNQPGPIGNVLIINVTLTAVGGPGDESSLTFSGTMLLDYTPDQHAIQHEVLNGRFFISESDEAPTVTIYSPANDTWYDSEEVQVTFYPQDDIDETIAFTVYVDGLERANGTAAVEENTTVNLSMPECDHVIRVEVKDGVGNTGSAEVTIHVARPPVLSNPSADPSVIPDDTDNNPGWGETATLNVTVTDESNIASVTINLTAIGGSPVQPMENIDGAIWSVTTNASVGTAGWNGSAYIPYLLQANATDEHGYSSTGIAITLMVMKNGDVNSDGVVTFGDTTYLANHLVGTSGFERMEDTIADVNGDSFINFGDVTYLSNHLVSTSGYELLK